MTKGLNNSYREQIQNFCTIRPAAATYSKSSHEKMWLQKPVSSPFRTTITNMILRVFIASSRGFHWFFMAFSRFHYFRKSGRHAIAFSNMGYLWGCDLAWLSLTRIRPKSNGIEKISVLKVCFNQAVSKGLGPSFSEDLDPQGDVENPPWIWIIIWSFSKQIFPVVHI